MKTGNLMRFAWALLMLFLAIVACTGTNTPTPAPTLAPAAVTSIPPSAVPISVNQGVSPVDLPSQRLDQAGVSLAVLIYTSESRPMYTG